MKNRLDRLKKISLKEIWDNEAQDFTPWLAEEKNLELLSETIRTPLELEAQEKDVGPFRADILCKNTEDDSWVLIENQIDKTDHKHLGQLLTYASGLQAVTIVWIAAKFTEEHRASLDWLNKITDDNFRFFGLEVELWKIGSSPAAPKFNIVSKPNNWSKTISQAAKSISDGIESETKAMQYRYWQGLIDYLENKGSKLRTQDPCPRHWQTFAVGRSHFYINARLNTRDNIISVSLTLADKSNAKAFYNLLLQDKENIESEIGDKLEWRELPDNTKSEISLSKNGVDTKNEPDWVNQHEWFKINVEKFDKVFRKRIKKLNPENWEN
ncbi:DUF4268 domain-containing protein [Rickettsiales bacterium]|nr:DUF4268 domain-containing protein [Rickettsiales bacterium]